MPELRVVGLDHVQLAMPAGAEADARRFFGSLLGLREVAKPPSLAARGGCWFIGPGVAIHLGVESDFRPARKAHVALLVADLDAARAALVSAGAPVVEDDAEIGVARFHTEDPFGNRLEIVAAVDAGFTQRAEASAAEEAGQSA